MDLTRSAMPIGRLILIAALLACPVVSLAGEPEKKSDPDHAEKLARRCHEATSRAAKALAERDPHPAGRRPPMGPFGPFGMAGSESPPLVALALVRAGGPEEKK